MTDILLKYFLDTTGTKSSNKVSGESHALNGRKVRALRPDYGLFFGKSMKVVDTASGKTLTPGTQYRPGEMDVRLTAKYGKSICEIVLITDENVMGPVELTYQVLGGEESVSRRALIDIVNSMDVDGEDIPFKDLVGVPDVFNPAPHKQHSITLYGMAHLVEAIKRLRVAVETGNQAAQQALSDFIKRALSDAETVSGTGATGAMQQHLNAANPHPTFALASDVAKQLAIIRQPLNVSPAASDSNVPLESPLMSYRYQSLYGVAQGAVQFQVSTVPDFSTLLYDKTLAAALSFKPDTLFPPGTTFYWRCRYQDIEGVWSDWSVATSFSTASISIKQPTLTAPTPGAQTNTETPTITTSAFAVIGSTDTHAATDWEVWTGPNGTGTRVWSSVNDLVNKLTVNVAPGILVQNGTYYTRARHRGTKYGYSAWAADVSFIAKWDPRPTVLGQVFGGGFYAGDITIGVGTFAVIVAPKSSEIVGTLTNSTTQTFNTSDIDSVANTNALVATATGSTTVVKSVKSLTIGGFNDWQVPALKVQQLIWANLRPSLASAPAAYKTGGAEAFVETGYYWTSTAYNWTNTYQDASTPNYGYYTQTDGPYQASAWYGPSDGTTPTPSCSKGTVVNVSRGYFFSIGPDGKPGSLNTTYWSCQYSTYGVISYTPGAYHSTNYYDAKIKSMNSAGSESSLAKDGAGAQRCRAVRLVQVA